MARFLEPRSLVAAVLSSLVAAGVLWRGPLIHAPATMPLVIIDGASRPEGCLRCHGQVQGLGPSHDPSVLGCSVCHLGNASALDAASAHQGMILLSGDLRTSERTCGQSGCHPDQAARVSTALMSGAPGLLAVNRFAFGERPTAAAVLAHDDLRLLDASRPPASAAESHVRKLCGSCHLGAAKPQAGDLGFESRGGGCTACHLAPPRPAPGAQASARVHPDVSSFVAEDRCAGCHSRSGRIALSFHGRMELEPPNERIVGRLPDGRSYGAASPDVHQSKGMTCIDCHGDRDLMGDGQAYGHSHEATHVRCEDCHGPWEASLPPSEDALRVAKVLRDSWEKHGRAPLPEGAALTTRDGFLLWRTHAPTRTLALASSGQRLEIPGTAPGAHHNLRGHERLSCQSCHTRWAPRCPDCHTSYDPGGTQVDHLTGQVTPGEWKELPSRFGSGQPALAVGPRGRIEPFVEGMTLRIDGWGPVIERTLWAPLDAHTTGASHGCPACHAPDNEALILPEQGETTRPGARLLDRSERERVLAVGACLPCHARAEDVIYKDFQQSRARQASSRCKGR